MRNTLIKIARRAALFLSRFRTISSLSEKVASYARGENNYDLETNGELNFIHKSAPGFRMVFDVGANVGDWTGLVLETNPNAKIFAFEPDPAAYAELVRRHGRSATCENLALGSSTEQRILFVHAASSGFNSFARRSIFAAKDLRELSVNVTTLDAYCEKAGLERIDCLKLDVEGFELQVLLGGEKMISKRRVAVVQFEYGGTYLDAGICLADAFEFFESRGYRLYKVLPRGLQRVKVYSQSLENFQYANYLAVSPEYSSSGLLQSGINVID